VQEPEGGLLLSCTTDDSHDVASHGPSMATSGKQRESSTVPSKVTTAKKLLGFRPFQAKKPPGAGTVMTVKQKTLTYRKTPTNPIAVQSGDKTASEVPSKKKTVRPAAWLLHSVGLRMVRERVYDDLIEIQEQKGSEGQLSGNEQRQLERLRGAHADLVMQNRSYSVRSRRRCRCGFAAGSRLELELHRDYVGNMSSDDVSFFCCCLCGLRNIRSPAIMYSHIERSHGRQPRMHSSLPAYCCPYCPYEHRSKATKTKLPRHIINCALTFRIDRNLAPTAADADIPLFEVANPPASSVQTSTTTSSVTSLKSSSSMLAEKVLNTLLIHILLKHLHVYFCYSCVCGVH